MTWIANIPQTNELLPFEYGIPIPTVFTLEANSFKIWDTTAASKIEQIIVRVFGDSLALIPVVVHVEALASGVSLAPTIKVVGTLFSFRLFLSL